MVDYSDINPYGDKTDKYRPDFKQCNAQNLDVSDEVIRRREGE